MFIVLWTIIVLFWLSTWISNQLLYGKSNDFCHPNFFSNMHLGHLRHVQYEVLVGQNPKNCIKKANIWFSKILVKNFILVISSQPFIVQKCAFRWPPMIFDYEKLLQKEFFNLVWFGMSSVILKIFTKIEIAKKYIEKPRNPFNPTSN